MSWTSPFTGQLLITVSSSPTGVSVAGPPNGSFLVSFTAPVIFIDHSWGWAVTLPSATTSAFFPTGTFDNGLETNLPMSFSVTWNGDAQDLYTIFIPQNVFLTTTNTPSFCTPSSTTSPPGQITFTPTSIHQCNYTFTWNGSTTAIIITYRGGSPVSPRTVDIYIPLGVWGGPNNGVVIRDLSSGFSGTMTTNMLPTGNNTSLAVEMSPHPVNANHYTTSAGSMRFALSWGGNAVSVFSLTIPSGLSITAESTDPSCSLSSAIILSSWTVHQCNYTASWTAPFNGQLLVYVSSSVIGVYQPWWSWTFGGQLLNTTFTIAFSAPFIYQDYTSGFSTYLPYTAYTTLVDTTYSTLHPGSFSFAIAGNNDHQDQYTLTIPSMVALATWNSPAFCAPTTTLLQITFTPTSVQQCNYTVSWSQPFSGQLRVVYTGGASVVAARVVDLTVLFVSESFSSSSSSSSSSSLSPSSSPSPSSSLSTASSSSSSSSSITSSSSSSSSPLPLPASSSSLMTTSLPTPSAASSSLPSPDLPLSSSSSAAAFPLDQTDQDGSSSSSSGHQTAIIAGVAGGGGVLIILCLAGLVWRARRTKRNTPPSPPPLPTRPPTVLQFYDSTHIDDSHGATTSLPVSPRTSSSVYSAIELPIIPKSDPVDGQYNSSSFSSSGMSSSAFDSIPLDDLPAVYNSASSRIDSGAIEERNGRSSVVYLH